MVDVWDLLVTAGSIGFIICTVPQGVRTWRTRRADDISWTFLIMVLVSSSLMLPYLLHKGNPGDFMFALAQAVNILVWGLVLAFKLKPRQGRKVIEGVEDAVAEGVAAVKQAAPHGDTRKAAGKKARKGKGRRGSRAASPTKKP